MDDDDDDDDDGGKNSLCFRFDICKGVDVLSHDRVLFDVGYEDIQIGGERERERLWKCAVLKLIIQQAGIKEVFQQIAGCSHGK